MSRLRVRMAARDDDYCQSQPSAKFPASCPDAAMWKVEACQRIHLDVSRDSRKMIRPVLLRRHVGDHHKLLNLSRLAACGFEACK